MSNYTLHIFLVSRNGNNILIWIWNKSAGNLVTSAKFLGSVKKWDNYDPDSSK